MFYHENGRLVPENLASNSVSETDLTNLSVAQVLLFENSEQSNNIEILGNSGDRPVKHPLKFRYAVNPKVVNKTKDFESLATGYQDTVGNIFHVRDHVAQGHALCGGLLGGQRRAKANVIGSSWLLLDIDNSKALIDENGKTIKGENGKAIAVYERQLTVEDALDNTFIQRHCALIYTTASSTPQWNKIRLVFLLPEYVDGYEAVEECTRHLMEHLPHDPSCKDASRVFYGNSKATFPLVNPHATLPLEWVQEARVTAEQKRLEFAARADAIAARKLDYRERDSTEAWDTDALIQQALSFIPSRSPGSNNYSESLRVLMALVDHYGPIEAEAIAEGWSPSIKGSTWQVGQKIRSFRRGNGVSLGTLFHIAKGYGFSFPTAQSPTSPLPRHQEPDAAEYAQYERWEVEQEQVEEAEAANDFAGLFKRLVGRVCDRVAVGFAKKQEKHAPVDKDAFLQPKGRRIRVILKGDYSSSKKKQLYLIPGTEYALFEGCWIKVHGQLAVIESLSFSESRVCTALIAIPSKEVSLGSDDGGSVLYECLIPCETQRQEIFLDEMLSHLEVYDHERGLYRQATSIADEYMSFGFSRGGLSEGTWGFYNAAASLKDSDVQFTGTGLYPDDSAFVFGQFKKFAEHGEIIFECLDGTTVRLRNTARITAIWSHGAWYHDARYPYCNEREKHVVFFESTQQTTHTYTPGSLPSYEKYVTSGAPKIKFPPEERVNLLKELASKKYQFVSDTSHPGSGKSHAIARLQPEDFGVQKIFYASAEHRNPTVAGIETEYVDLPTRIDGGKHGLIADPTKETVSGSPHVRHVKSGERASLPGNCVRTGIFIETAAKGYAAEMGAKASVNAACQSCSYAQICPTPKYVQGVSGFRYLRMEAMRSPKIRCHLDSLPSADDLGEGEGKLALFIDEIGRQLKPVELIEVTAQDLDKTLVTVKEKLPEVYDLVMPVVAPVLGILLGESGLEPNRYGHGDEEIRQVIGRLPEDHALVEATLRLRELLPDLENLLKEADSVSLDGVSASDKKTVSRDTLAYIRKTFAREARDESYDNVKAIPPNWLIPFLLVLMQLTPGALRIVGNRLSIARRNDHQGTTIQGYHFVVAMDATYSRGSFASAISSADHPISPYQIALIQEEIKPYSNLVIHHVKGMGLLGKSRSESMHKRVSALRSHLKSLHSDIQFIDHLATKEAGDGHWFADSRGSNRFQRVSALASLGTPFSDIGALAVQYQVLTGDKDVSRNSKGFSKYVSNSVQSETIQCPGRLRANRRTETVHYYAITDYDISFLRDAYPGCKLVEENAGDLCLDAADRATRTRWGILQAARSVAESGQRLTQQAIASTAAMSQSMISKIAKQCGGWKLLKKLLCYLLHGLGVCSTGGDLTDEERWLAKDYLPLLQDESYTTEEVITEVSQVAQSVGDKAFERILAYTPLQVKAYLTGKLFSILPMEMLNAFIDKIVLQEAT